MELHSPVVSVIIATYNRSQVLHYAIASVIHSTFTDWELIVVGDACTDDSESVVRFFKDPRIRFFNLKENFGDQGGPNNEGFRHAHGRYIAYLSHDDLWMPDHLETALRGMKDTGADFVTTLGVSVTQTGQNTILGTLAKDCFIPTKGIPASVWLLKREVLEEVGPWRHPRECIMHPSQDIIFRAWKQGKRICTIPKITVIALPAGARPGIYAIRESGENKMYFERMQQEPNFLERELLSIVCQTALKDAELRIWPYIRRGLGNFLRRGALKLGITPAELYSLLYYRRKGKSINRWRTQIGLSKLK